MASMQSGAHRQANLLGARNPRRKRVDSRSSRSSFSLADDLVERFPFPLAILGGSLHFLSANAKMVELLGRPIEAILGRTPGQLKLPGYIRSAVRQASSSGKAYRAIGTVALLHESHNAEAIAFPISRGERGCWIVGFAVCDTSEGDKLEQLEKDKELLAEAECLGNLGTWEYDPVSGKVEFSSALSRLLQLGAGDEHLARPLFNCFALDTVRSSLRTSGAIEHDATCVLPDGSSHLLSTRAKWFDGSGRRKIIGITRDVTKEKRAERVLRANETRLQALLGSIDEIVFEFDALGTHLNIWTSNEDLLAFPKNERIGRTLTDVYGKDIAQPFLDVFARVLNTGQSENIEYSLMVRGTPRWYLGRVNRVPGIDGNPATICLLSRHITDRKNAEFETRRLALIVENTQDLAGICNLDLQMIFMNPAGQLLVGLANPDDVQKTRLTDYFATADRQYLTSEILPRVIQGEPWEGELRLNQFKKARTSVARWNIFRIDNPSGLKPANIACVATDISVRKQFENALRQKEATISRLFRISKTLNTTLDFDVVVSTVIRETIDITGAEGGIFALRTPAGFKCEKYLRGNRPVPLEHQWPAGQGIPHWILTNQKAYLNNNVTSGAPLDPVLLERFKTRHVLCVPVLDASGHMIGFFGVHNKKVGAGFTGSDFEKIVLIAQIAAIAIQNALAYRKIRHAEEELRLLSTRLLESQDQERRRIARELHDQTANSLASVHMNLRRMAVMNGDLTPAAHAMVDESLQMTDQSIDELRTLSYVLHPPLLDEEGLGAAIDWYAAGFTKRCGIQVKVNVPESLGRLSPEHEMAIFRVVQESLNNIRRHSGAEFAVIRLRREAGRAILEVEDRGRGMVSSRAPDGDADRSTGVGIAGMRERVRHVGGTFEITSAAPRGTLVRVELPAEGTTWNA